MKTRQKITTGILAAAVALGGGAATVEITASRGVDAIIANEVASAEDVASTMTLLKWRKGKHLERLKKHLLPLATEIKNNGRVEILKLDELYALQSFGADVEIIMESGGDFTQAMYKYFEEQLK